MNYLKIYKSFSWLQKWFSPCILASHWLQLLGAGKVVLFKDCFLLCTLQWCKCDYTQILFSSPHFHNRAQTFITSNSCNHCCLTKQGTACSALLLLVCSASQSVPLRNESWSHEETCPRPLWEVSSLNLAAAASWPQTVLADWEGQMRWCPQQKMTSRPSLGTALLSFFSNDKVSVTATHERWALL